MSRMMSRRAVLRAIGVSPVVLAASGVSGRQAHAEATKAVVSFWDPAFTADLDRVVAEGKRRHGGGWTCDEEATYRRVARNLYTFYLSGIEYTRKKQNVPVLGAPADFLWTAAFNCQGTDSGDKVAVNLANFRIPHGPMDVETEICAWRCGRLAAGIELTANPASQEVGCASYKEAWLKVKGNTDMFFAKLNEKNSFEPMAAGGGAC